MRRLIFLLAVGLGGAAILVALGIWQVQRLAWKEAILAQVDARVSGAPVDLPATLDRTDDRYLPVRAAGTIEAEAIFVLVSRKQIGAGYRMISPLVMDTGRRVLVDRGFIRAADRAAFTLEAFDADVVGNLHWPDEIDGFTPESDLDAGIWFARDVDAMAATLAAEPTLIVAQRVTNDAAALSPLPVDSAAIPNNHLQYAITWFSLALIWAAMTAYFTYRGLGRRTKG